MPRVALIHALKHSPPPIEAAFARLWPQARLCNLLDDSLSADLAAAGCITEAMTGRFLDLARYSVRVGADAILFTCSAFGPCIEACARELAPLPVLSFEPTLRSPARPMHPRPGRAPPRWPAGRCGARPRARADHAGLRRAAAAPAV